MVKFKETDAMITRDSRRAQVLLEVARMRELEIDTRAVDQLHWTSRTTKRSA